MENTKTLNYEQRQDERTVIEDRRAIKALNGYVKYSKNHTSKETLLEMMYNIIDNPQTKGDSRLSDIILTDGGDLTPPPFNRLAKHMAKIWYGSIFPYQDNHDNKPLPKAQLKKDIDYYLSLTPVQLKAELSQMVKSMNEHLADDKQSIKEDANLDF